MSDPRLDGTEIADSVIDLVGNTPLVRMKRVSEDQGIRCVLALKAETTNWARLSEAIALILGGAAGRAQ